MKLIIDMPEEEYKCVQITGHIGNTTQVSNAILNGIPLSKGHSESCEDCVSRHAVDALVDELARAISDERCFLSRGRSTASIMQDILDLPSVTPQSKIVETGWGEMFLLDGMSQFIKKEMEELLKSPWAQDKTLTPHDMAVKEAFATVKDLILSKFEIKEGWENLIHGQEDGE